MLWGGGDAARRTALAPALGRIEIPVGELLIKVFGGKNKKFECNGEGKFSE